jgi:hypothetical protein
MCTYTQFGYDENRYNAIDEQVGAVCPKPISAYTISATSVKM